MAGGPAGAFIAVAFGVELGKMVSKETKIDIIVTPAVTLIAGAIGAKFVGPAIGWCMIKLGDIIMTATGMAAIRIRHSDFDNCRTCSYSTYFKRRYMHHDGLKRVLPQERQQWDAVLRW